MKKADAILTADWHCMDRTPVCRTDDFEKAMIKKMWFIDDLASKHDCPVLIAGDMLDKHTISPYLTSTIIAHLCKHTYFSIPGNHELASHNLNNFLKSSLNVLSQCGTVNVITETRRFVPINTFEVHGIPYNQEIPPVDLDPAKKSVLMIHHMVHKDKPIHKDIESTKALSLLKKYNYDLIVVGDNHNPFVVEYKGKVLVNCGSLMRIRADQIDYKPAVWLWYADTNTVEPVIYRLKKE